jgi:hypothetical protein
VTLEREWGRIFCLATSSFWISYRRLPFGILIASCDLIYEISHIFILRQAECDWILLFFPGAPTVFPMSCLPRCPWWIVMTNGSWNL